jgi:hypothetical protein
VRGYSANQDSRLTANLVYSTSVFISVPSPYGPSNFGPPGSGLKIICSDPDPAPDSSTSKTILKKPRFLQFCDFLIPCYLLKTDVNITTVSIKQKDLKKTIFHCHLESH